MLGFRGRDRVRVSCSIKIRMKLWFSLQFGLRFSMKVSNRVMFGLWFQVTEGEGLAKGEG